MPRAVKFPASQTCQMGSRSLLTIWQNLTDAIAQVSRWGKERECDNADKPLEVLTNAVTFAGPGGY